MSTAIKVNGMLVNVNTEQSDGVLLSVNYAGKRWEQTCAAIDEYIIHGVATNLVRKVKASAEYLAADLAYAMGSAKGRR